MATKIAYEIKVTKSEGNWQIGTINGVQFWVKAYAEDSENGINGGNISKLSIEKIAEYDRDWCDAPKTRGGQNLVNALVEYFAQPEMRTALAEDAE